MNGYQRLSVERPAVRSQSREHSRPEVNSSDVLEIVGPVGSFRNSMPTQWRELAQKTPECRGKQLGGWGTLKSRFPEDLAPLADELIE